MKSIKEDVKTEIMINKSKFITFLIRVNSIDDIKEKLDYYKKLYKDATHMCYGYIVDGYEKCSDDKEPSGAAGMPILNVLRNNDLNYVLCIVIRYFGGIKLGASGLVRAYSNSASSAIDRADITDLVEGYLLKIEFDYEHTKAINAILKKYEIEKSFDEKIVYRFKVSVKEYNEIEILLKKYVNTISKKPILLSV